MPQGRVAAQQRASAPHCPPSLSGAAMCTPTLSWASVPPARSAVLHSVLGSWGQARREAGRADGNWLRS